MLQTTEQSPAIAASKADKPSSKKSGAVVNVAKLDPEDRIGISFSPDTVNIVSGQRYIPFGKDDNLPNKLWEARLNSVTHNACVSSIAKTCVGSGLYVTNYEQDKVDPDFVSFIANINNEESLSALIESGIDCVETDGNAWAEVTKGSIGSIKYVRAYMHSTLVSRFEGIPVDKERPVSVIRSLKFADKRNRIVSSRSLKAVSIPLYSPNKLDAATSWKSIFGDQHTIIHLKNSFKGVMFYGVPRSVAGLIYQVLESKSAQYNLDNFENNMVMSGLIVFKSPMTQTEANASAKEIIKTHTGAGKNGRVGVISSENGIDDFTWVPLETKKEGSFIELDKNTVQKIITASNWDAIFFGMGDEGTLGKGSGYVRAVYDIKKTTVIDPICNYWITRFVIPLVKIAAEHLSKPEWLKYEFAFKSSVPFSYSSDISVNKVLTKNEGRETLGKSKMDGPEWEQPIENGNAKQKQDVPPEPPA